TKTDQTVEQITSRYYNATTPEELTPILTKVATANNLGSLGAVEYLRDSVMARVPSDYKDMANLTAGFDSLMVAWPQVRINWDRFAEASNHYTEGIKDGSLNTREIERIQFAVERARTRFIPEELTLPFSAKFDGDPTVLAASNDLLMIGTTSGLVRFNGKNWQTFTTGAGLPSDTIIALRTISNTVIVGTTSGLARFNGLTVEPFDTASNAPTGRVDAIGGGSPTDFFAVVSGELYRFHGSNWVSTTPYTVVIDDTPEKIAAKFSIYDTPDDIDAYLVKYRATLGEKTLNPGDVIDVPLLGLIKGKATALASGTTGQTVWLGTDYGVMFLDREGWQLPGYRDFSADTITTVAQVAALRKEYQGTSVDSYIEALKAINSIPDGIIAPNQSVRIYKNPAASPVTSIDFFEQTVYVGTENGLLEYAQQEWSRSDFRGLGNEPTRRISLINDQLWGATDRRMTMGATARPQISTMYVKWLPELADDLYYTFFSYVQNVRSVGTLGASVSFISYGKIQRTDEQGNPQGEFDAFDFAFQASYGTSLTNKIKGGISAKFLWSHLAEQGQAKEKGKGTSTGFAIDLGLLYHLNPKMNLGVALTNLGPKMAYIDANQADDLPRNLAVGVAYKLINSEDTRITTTAEYNKMMVGLNDPLSDELFKQAVYNAGVEGMFLNLISGRFGYIYDEEGDVKVWTIGAGIRAFDRFMFDFAYIPSGQSVALSNILRVSVSAAL
ncbi:MAG: PorV/PorQ family protein, partial [candidate division Zixibacteria bacterium]|nr:PorV/PorQ family protein [candidate division Zixibacteria bacterium]